MDSTVFFEKLYPFATQVCEALGLPLAKLRPVLLAQWAHESGFEAPEWVGHNNYSGITDGGPPNFLQYPTIDAFAQDHARVLSLSYYADVRAAAAAGFDAETVAVLLGSSPWDAGHYMPSDGPYAGVPGGYLVAIMREYQLTEITPSPATAPEPMPEPEVAPAAAADPAPEEAKPDVPDEWAAPAAAWVVQHGISDGTRAHAQLTRQEFWTMLYRFAGGK